MTVQTVQEHTLPPTLADLVQRYDEEIGCRTEYVWKWFHKLCPHFRLSSVPEEYSDTVRELKTLLTVYATLVDDLVEDLNDQATFEQAVNIPFDHRHVDLDRGDVDSDYLGYTQDVWGMVETELMNAPRHSEFTEIFDYDLRQVVNAIRYALVVNRHPDVANVTEAYAFDSYNMVVFPYTDIDLMYSPSFDRGEFAELRELVWRTQRMARIGNWVSTWEREIHEGDLSSGVVAQAATDDVVSLAELQVVQETPVPSVCNPVCEQIDAANVERTFREDWCAYRQDIEDSFELTTVDVSGYINGFETVFKYQIESKGHK